MNSNFMQFDFGKLYYSYIDNKSDKSIIFLHGNASSASSFYEICNLLKDNFNIFCIDFPGHGLSEHIDIDKHSYYYSFFGLRDILVSFYNTIKAKNIFIAGNSLGANIAVQSLPFLSDIKGLILMASIHAKDKEAFFKTILPTAPRELSLKKELNDYESKILIEAFIHDAKNNPIIANKMREDIKNSDGNFRTQLIHYIEKQGWPNERQLLEKNNLPLLIIGGLQDSFINLSYYDELEKMTSMNKSQFHLLNNVGHVPHLEDPISCARLITDFTACYN